jgi:rhodanese-related sulfurtransferase
VSSEAVDVTKLRLPFGSTTCALILFAAFAAAADARMTNPPPQPAPGSSADAAIPASELLQPAELAQLLRSTGVEKPLILQVGSHVLYAQAHIPGAEYAGAGGQEAGLEALRARVKGLKPDQQLVIYCGCCPWNRCPNIQPAYRQLHELGFTQVKALYLANNFGADWVDKGYPVARGR